MNIKGTLGDTEQMYLFQTNNFMMISYIKTNNALVWSKFNLYILQKIQLLVKI